MSENPIELLSPEARPALTSFARRPCLMAFDLDGTLVPIIRDYRKVKLSPKTRELLKQLCRHHPVAVVSGRSRKDLRKLVPLRKIHLIGNHGLEGIQAVEEKSYVRVWKSRLEDSLRHFKGASLEDKGLTLTVHYRLCSRKEAVRTEILDVVSHFPVPARVVLGKEVINLLPPTGGNKGTAVLHLMKKLKCPRCIYLGDDITDEDVFELSRKKVLSARVGYSTKTKAPYYLKSQKEMDKLLTELLRADYDRHSRTTFTSSRRRR